MIAADQLPAAELPRPRTLLVGTVFAIVACGMFFAGAFGVYLKLRSDALTSGGEWIKAGQISLVPGGMMMATAGMSVVTMAWAVQAIGNDDRKNAYTRVGHHVLVRHREHQPTGLLLHRHEPPRSRDARPVDLRHHRRPGRDVDRRS